VWHYERGADERSVGPWRLADSLNMQSVPQPGDRTLVRASRIAAGWAFWYGLYRWYYAAGGTIGMLGTPVSEQQFRLINAIAGALLLVWSVLPLMLLSAWRSRRARPVLLALCWVVAVGCVSHALIGVVQRVSSLTGTLTISYPFWLSIDRRQADLQALFFNEPWFLIEGLLWACPSSLFFDARPRDERPESSCWAAPRTRPPRPSGATDQHPEQFFGIGGHERQAH